MIIENLEQKKIISKLHEKILIQKSDTMTVLGVPFFYCFRCMNCFKKKLLVFSVHIKNIVVTCLFGWLMKYMYLDKKH